MKFRVTYKDPDSLQDQIDDAVKASLAGSGLTDAESEAVGEVRGQELRNLAATWFQYGEYLTVEIDTDAKTCTVMPVSH